MTRPALKQIDFRFDSDLDFDIEQEFPNNSTVEEITFLTFGQILSFKILRKVFNALPNIKRVRFVNAKNNLQGGEIENLFSFLKIISDFEKLESLHFAMDGLEISGVQKIQDCSNIINNFPIRAKVVIADMVIDLANVIEKEEGKPPKIVKKSQSRYLLSGSSFIRGPWGP